MTIAEQIGSIALNQERASRSKQFAHVARYLMLARGRKVEALEMATANRATPEILSVLKAATTFIGTGDATALTGYKTIADGFLGSLKQISAFDLMLQHMPNVPFRTRIISVLAGMTGNSIAESKPKGLGTVTLSAHQLAEHKAVALMVLTKEILRTAPISFFENELRRAVAITSDQIFIDLITDTVPTINKTGVTAAAIRADIGNALASIDSGAGSVFFALMSSNIAKVLSTLSDDGGAAFPGMSPSGGTICGLTAVVSGGMDDSMIVIADASGIVAASGSIRLDASEHATLQMSDVPDDPVTGSTTLRSLFQNDEVALCAERFLGAERYRDAVSVIVGYDSSP